MEKVTIAKQPLKSSQSTAACKKLDIAQQRGKSSHSAAAWKM